MPIHLKLSREDIGDPIITVGDPRRSHIISQVLDSPKLVNEYRGFITYTGYFNGEKVTVATHGIGGASSAIVFEELYMMGAKTIIRLGTTGSLRKDINIGDIIVADGAVYGLGGTIGMYIGDLVSFPAVPDLGLTLDIYRKLKSAASKYNVYLGTVYSSDAFYAEDEKFAEKWSSRGVLSVEMECATLFVLSKLRGFRSACVLIVSDNLPKSERIDSLQVLDSIFTDVAKHIFEAYHSER